MTRDQWTATGLAALYLASRAAWRGAGVHLVFDLGLWQLLPSEVLRHHYWSGLLALHSQPPLFNAIVGLALQSPWPEHVMSGVLFAAGLTVTLGLFVIMRRLGLSRPVAAIATAAYVLNPAMLAYDHFGSYTMLEVAFVVAGIAALSVWGEAVGTGRPAGAAPWVFASTASALILMRALFHPAWGVLIALAARPWLARDGASSSRRSTWMLWIPVVVGALLMAKNYWLIGEPVTSSWLGLNASRVVVHNVPDQHVDALVGSGTISRLEHIDAFRPLSDYEPYRALYVSRVPVPAFTHLALTTVSAAGHTNYNHVEYVGISRVRWHDTLVFFRHYPMDLFWAFKRSVWRFDDPAVHESVAIHDQPVLAAPATWADSVVPRAVQRCLIWLGMAIVFIAGALVHRRASRGDPGAAAILPAMVMAMITVAWVLLVGNLFETGENNRFRVTVDPLIFAAVVWAASSLYSRLRQSS